MDAHEQPSAHFPAPSSEIVQAARRLRQRETAAETVLWSHLRGRRLLGRKFRRQHPVGPYVLDFFCDDAHLVVEIDGAVHFDLDQRERDVQREDALAAMGLAVLRFPNEDVLHKLADVLRRIGTYVKQHSYDAEGVGSTVKKRPGEPPSGVR